MFGAKQKTVYKPDVRDNMDQFAIELSIMAKGTVAEILNNWCYEHNCIPLNFKLEGSTIFAIVKRVK